MSVANLLRWHSKPNQDLLLCVDHIRLRQVKLTGSQTVFQYTVHQTSLKTHKTQSALYVHIYIRMDMTCATHVYCWVQVENHWSAVTHVCMCVCTHLNTTLWTTSTLTITLWHVPIKGGMKLNTTTSHCYKNIACGSSVYIRCIGTYMYM